MSDLTSKNKALMRRIYEEMWNRADPSIAAEIFDQPDGVERFLSQFLLSFPDLQHTIEEVIAEDKIIEHHTWWDKMGLVEQIGGERAA